ncbi:alpha/beta hydrolase [Ekhidna sp. To15]|uniref:alpha/beta hydrolase n=1 Tax=Ekhidna sp. To15 TaxID=3395267 RepID=UPI003F527A65
MQHHINISIKASYHTLNKLTEKTERVWLVFHGYGQLAEYFIKKFEDLDPEKNFIIAPQGLSKYYLNGVYGRVGASWMTKEDRLTEIENQYAYIDAVLHTIGDISNKQLIYFGFSQGTATMGRYAAQAKVPFHQMIIWAGTFPPDTNPEDWKYLTGEEGIHYYTSKEDIYFKEEMIPQQNEVVKKALGREPQLHWYDGGHRVMPEIVASL